MAVCSIAMAAGVLCVGALVKRLFFMRRFGGAPWRSACGHGFGAWGPPFAFAGRAPWAGRRWHGLGRSVWLRAIFDRLDTTPGQEREIRAAIEDVQRAAREERDGLSSSRADLAKAIAGDVFDEAAIIEASTRVDGSASHVKEAFVTALRRVHAVLDPRQRERLSELLTNGPRGRRSSPYRDASV